MESVAIIGTGIAGMACAHRIHRNARITLFEAEKEPGGHTHTVDVTESGQKIPVDTGFMVYNEITYPLLTSLFKELEVETMETDMSFGVQYRPLNIEYCGSSISQVFAQRRNLVSPQFLRMLWDVGRFNRKAIACLKDPDVLGLSLQEFVDKNRFGSAFLHQYLVPMTSAIWSTPPDEMLQFPAHTLIRFMYNHGLLGIRTQHQWRTVVGGSRSYRDKLLKPFEGSLQCNCPIRSVKRSEQGVELIDEAGKTHRFDRVVIATHADAALKLLENPTDSETRLLSCFHYAKNTITLHTDPSVMPQNPKAWASWNYRLDGLKDGKHQASTHYWMNSLQNLQAKEPYFVSVNEPNTVDRNHVLQEFIFDHPMFDKAAVQAQGELPKLNKDGKIFYCGSYFRYGFHEDGLMAGYSAAESLLSHTPNHAKLAV